MGRLRRLLACTVVLGALVLGQPSVAHADVWTGTDSDAENGLWDCPTRHVAFGDPAVDVLRCLTFRFDVPDDLEGAVLYLDIDAPSNSLQDTDSLVVAVAEPFDDCAWAQGTMAGCVAVHGGFVGGEKSLVVDLLDLTCDATVSSTVDTTRQAAVRRQIETGVVHVMLQDDTAVNGAWLDVNGRDAPACGTTAEVVPVSIINEAQRPGGATGGDGGGSATRTAIAVVAGVLALGAGVLIRPRSVRKARARRAQPDVRIEREVDEGRVHLEESGEHRSVAIGVKTWPDDVGVQSLEEAST